MHRDPFSSQMTDGISLTALEIHDKEFDRRLRGYDEEQVDEFLDVIIKDYEAFERQIKDLKDQIDRLSNHTEYRSVTGDTANTQLYQRIRELEIHCFGKSKD